MPYIYADSIQARTVIEASNKIRNSGVFEEAEEDLAVRIITKLISSRIRKSVNNEVAESRVDYISDD